MSVGSATGVDLDALEAALWLLAGRHSDSGAEGFDEYVAEYFRSTPRDDWHEESFEEYLDAFAEGSFSEDGE